MSHPETSPGSIVGHGRVPKRDPQGTGEHGTENTVAVNGNGSAKTREAAPWHRAEPDRTDLRRLPDLHHDRHETQSVAECILAELGDRHSQSFYHLVAAKVPERVIRTALSEIRHDGAQAPARVFAHRMKRYAAEALAAAQHRDIRGALANLSQQKSIGLQAPAALWSDAAQRDAPEARKRSTEAKNTSASAKKTQPY